MVGFKKKKKEKTISRNPHLNYQRQQAYHYSAKRSGVDRARGRELANEDADPETSGGLRVMSRALSIFTALLVGVGLLYIVGLSTTPDISIEGEAKLLSNPGELQDKAKGILEGSVNNRTKLTIDTDKVASSLLAAYPELASAKVNASVLYHKPHITVTVARPTLVLISGNNKYIISERGKVLFDASRASVPVDIDKLPLLQDQSSFGVEVGKNALTAGQVVYVSEVVYQAGQNALTVQSMAINGGGGELQVKYSGSNYYVKYNFFEDARKSAGTFLATKQQLERDKVTPSEYIDVRIPERAYVK